MFDMVLTHSELFDISAHWMVLGKVQRQAADAVMQDKVSIQNAHEFYQWAKANEKSIEICLLHRGKVP